MNDECISNLEQQIRWIEEIDAHKFPGWGHAVGAMRQAIVLLKAQEPRVMTLEEIPDAIFGWMEMFGQLIPCVLEDVYVDDTVGFANIEDGHDYMCASDYGKTWRCWTSRPTDAQMEATAWQKPENG